MNYFFKEYTSSINDTLKINNNKNYLISKFQKSVNNINERDETLYKLKFLGKNFYEILKKI